MRAPRNGRERASDVAAAVKGELPERLRVPERLVRDLDEVIRIVDLDHPNNRCAIDQEHKDAMRLYLRSWAAAPLRRMREYLVGQIDAKQYASGRGGRHG